MEPHKLKEKLQKRSFTPSENSWKQLRKKLDAKENVQPIKKWIFLKYAAVALVFISVGFYFFKPVKNTIEAPIIAAPTLKEDLKKIQETSKEPEIRVAETPVKHENKTTNSSFKKDAITTTPEKEFVAFTKTEKQLLISETKNLDTAFVEISPATILIAEQPSEEALLDAEVDQLLKNSNIKLHINRQFSTKRTVNAQALLTEVEDDLDKDFKDKLVETIVTTFKKPRKVVITDRGN